MAWTTASAAAGDGTNAWINRSVWDCSHDDASGFAP